jgi:hypothetical protein
MAGKPPTASIDTRIGYMMRRACGAAAEALSVSLKGMSIKVLAAMCSEGDRRVVK